MRCIWCNQAGGELERVVVESSNRFAVSPETKEYWVHTNHRQQFLAFNERKERYGKLFLIAMLAPFGILIVLEPILVIMDKPRIALATVGAIVMAVGFAAIALPFATPETVRWLGLRRAIAIVRVAATLMVFQGLWVLSLSFTYGQ